MARRIQSTYLPPSLAQTPTKYGGVYTVTLIPGDGVSSSCQSRFSLAVLTAPLFLPRRLARRSPAQ